MSVFRLLPATPGRIVGPALILGLIGCGLLGETEGSTRQAQSTPIVNITAATPQPGASQITIYLPRLFEDGSLGLQAVPRHVLPSDDPARDALTALIQGPNGNERADDYQYALDRRTQIVGMRLEGGTAEVDLDDRLRRVQGRPFSELVYWSIVYTLTEVPGIEAVTLWGEGKPLTTLGDPPFALPARGSRAAAPAWARPR